MRITLLISRNSKRPAQATVRLATKLKRLPQTIRRRPLLVFALMVLAAAIATPVGYKMYSNREYNKLLIDLREQNYKNIDRYVAISKYMNDAMESYSSADYTDVASMRKTVRLVGYAQREFDAACKDAQSAILKGKIHERIDGLWISGTQRSYLDQWARFLEVNNSSQASDQGVCDEYVALAIIKDMATYSLGLGIATLPEIGDADYQTLVEAAFADTASQQKGAGNYPASIQSLKLLQKVVQAALHSVQASSDGNTEQADILWQNVDDYMQEYMNSGEGFTAEINSLSRIDGQHLIEAANAELDLLRFAEDKHLTYGGIHADYAPAIVRLTEGLILGYSTDHDDTLPDAHDIESLVSVLDNEQLTHLQASGKLKQTSYSVLGDKAGYSLDTYKADGSILRIRLSATGE